MGQAVLEQRHLISDLLAVSMFDHAWHQQSSKPGLSTGQFSLVLIGWLTKWQVVKMALRQQLLAVVVIQ